MRSTCFFVAVLCAVAPQAVGSTRGVLSTVTFDFDTLAVPRFDFAISNYMTSVYGSSVSTDGARSLFDEEPDVFIATSIQLLGRGNFEVFFDDVPIVGAEFEGHVINATAGDDFSFSAFFDETLVHSFTRSEGTEVFDSGWLDFGGPVNRLLIADSGIRDVGIDQLVVQPIPEPASGLALLVLAGAIGLCKRR
jgi:hypothetical protein